MTFALYSRFFIFTWSIALNLHTCWHSVLVPFHLYNTWSVCETLVKKRMRVLREPTGISPKHTLSSDRNTTYSKRQRWKILASISCGALLIYGLFHQALSYLSRYWDSLSARHSNTPILYLNGFCLSFIKALALKGYKHAVPLHHVYRYIHLELYTKLSIKHLMLCILK